MDKHWIRLTEHDGTTTAWLNMAAVAVVRQDERGPLYIQMIGAQESDPTRYPVITKAHDIAAILAYLQGATGASMPPGARRPPD